MIGASLAAMVARTTTLPSQQEKFVTWTPLMQLRPCRLSDAQAIQALELLATLIHFGLDFRNFFAIALMLS